MAKLKFFIPAVLFVGLVIFFLIGLTLKPGQIDSPFIGKPAPAMDLPSLFQSEQRVRREDLLGQFSLLNVWGTWCPGCREEHDALLTIAADYKMPIYGLNWKDDPLQAIRWLQQLGNPYVAVAVDKIGNTAIDWGVYGAPETFLIGPDGTVLQKQIGPMTLDIWRDDFLPLINIDNAGAGS